MSDWESAPAVGGPGTTSTATPEWMKAPPAQQSTQAAWQSAPPVQHTPQGPMGTAPLGAVTHALQDMTTPTGGAPSWKTAADAEIQSRESGRQLVQTAPGVYEPQQTRPPAPLSTSEKIAIYDAHRAAEGFGPDKPEYGQVMADQQADQQAQHVANQSALQNFSAAGASSLARFGTGVVGAVAPQAAAGMQANQAATYQFDPDRPSGVAGQFVGNTLPLVPAMVPGAGGLVGTGVAGAAGLSQFGSVRQDVAQRRAQGEQISTGAELAAAGAQAATMFLAQKVGLSRLGGPGKVLGAPVLTAAEQQSMRAVVESTVAKYAANAGIQGSDFMLMQAANNGINKALIDHEQKMGQGVGEAGLTGLATGVVGTALHGGGGAPQQQNHTEVPVPSAETLESLKTAPKQESGNATVSPGSTDRVEVQPGVQTPGQSGLQTPEPSGVQGTEGKVAAGDSQPAGDLQNSKANTNRPLVDAAEPKYRVTNGAESQGVPLDFASAEDKALYLATVPRKGKVAMEAAAYLKEQGYKPEDIERYGDELRDRIASSAKNPPAEGHPLHVEALEPEATQEVSAPAPSKSEPQMLPGQPDERLARNEDDQTLERVMKGAYRVTSGLGEHQEVLDLHKELTGQDAIPYAGGRGRGFRAEGKTFYSVEANRTPQLRREAIAHEATHHLQDTRPDLVNQLDRAIPADTRAELLKEYQKSYQRQEGKALSTDMHAKEIQAMAVGRIFSRPSVARQVMQENPGLFTRAADTVITKLRSLTSSGRLTNQVVEFLKNAREQSAKMAADRGEPSQRRVREAEPSNFLPEHSPRVRDEAEEYTRQAGIPYHPDSEYVKVNEDRARQIADHYANAKHDPSDPAVKASYDAMKRETMNQFRFLEKKGVEFEPWRKEGQPYKDSGEMLKDVRDNKHLYFFQGGDLPHDHPLAERAPGTPYTYNDVFRAVHDYFGHAKEGVGFGPRGEENAWRSHSQMYSEEARPAMTTETRGQNSWVNFGPHGEHNQANPTKTIYAEQKATTLPSDFTKVEQANGVQFLPGSGKPLKEYLDNLSDEDAATTKEVKKYLTPEEWKSLNEPEAKRMVALFRDLPPDAEFKAAAGAGEAKRGWYEKATATIKSLFGPDARRFATVLAADSPRQSVEKNLEESLRAWQAWDAAGRPTDKAEVEKILTNQPETLVKLSGRIPNLLRALTGPEGAELSGYKVNSFAGNLQGDMNRVTNDTWMAKFGGLDQKVFADNGGYLGYSAKVRRVAKSMGITPAEVQETVWSFFKTLTERVGVDTTGKEALKNLTHEDVASTPAFTDMLGNDYVHNALRQLGFTENDLQRATRAADKAGPDREAPTGHITGRNPGVLEGIAERAEQQAPNKPSAATKAQGALFLPESVRQFRDEDVTPRLAAAADAVSSAWEGTKNLLGLQSTPAARQTKGILRERGAELAQRMDRLTEAFGPSKAAMDSMPQADTRAFIDNMEKGQAQADPKLQPIADALRGLLDDRLQQVQSRGKLANFIQDYFPHLWANPDKARAFSEAAARRPMEGGKSFLRQRTLPLFSDGIAAGLEPVTENPVEAAMLRVREMDKFITAHDALTEMKARGLLKKVPARGALPEGYAKINDSVGTIYAPPNRKGGISIAGFFAAPESVASVINNNLSPGLRNDPHFGGLFRGYLGAGNILNQSSLGLSVFHGTTSALNAAVSEFGLGIKDAVEGRPGQGIKRMGFGLSLVGPAARDYWNGSQVLKEWNKPGSTTPDIAAVVDAMKAGGGRAGMDDFYHTGATDKMMEAFRKGNTIGGAMRLPLAALEQTSKPVLEYLVPRLKMGAFMQAAKTEMENNPGMGRDEMRRRMGAAWNAVDNRFGEMVHDNIFWNRTVKDLAMASFRSVGWNMGTFRELGGGLKDFASMGRRMMLDRSMANVEMTHRMAYTTALPVLTGIVGAVVHKMLSGDDPKELKDYYFPKTGEKDKDGHDVRLALPSYMKDVYAFSHSPFHTLANKSHPMLNTILEMLENKDYYGTKIRNEDDPAMKQGLSLLEHLGSAAAPISLKDTVKLVSEGQGSKAILPAVGITHAPGYITKSPAELKAQELMEERMPRGTRTQEQADRSAKVRDLATLLKAHDATASQKIGDAIRGGQIGANDVENIRERQKYPNTLARNVAHLDMPGAMKVWEAASEEEKRALAPIVLTKLRGSKTLTREERVGYLATLQADLKRIKGGSAAVE